VKAVDEAGNVDASGVAQGGEFRVNTYTAGDQMYPAVAMNRTTGDFVVVWESYGQAKASAWSIYAQRYNLAGAAQGGDHGAGPRAAAGVAVVLRPRLPGLGR